MHLDFDFQPINMEKFSVKKSEILGNYLVARKKLKPGEIIIEEHPLVVAPSVGFNRIQCIGCHVLLDAPHQTCTGCDWPLCSINCAAIGYRYGHTSAECNVLRHTRKGIPLNYNAIGVLRCLLLKNRQPKAYQKIISMEAHDNLRKQNTGVWLTNQETVVNRIRNEWHLKVDSEEIHHICGVLEVNSFEICSNSLKLRALYPTAYLIAHDCIPNTNHCDGAGHKLTIRASVDISIGQTITLSYANTLESTDLRRDFLLKNKFFECHCKRCDDPMELEAKLGALACPQCEQGFILPSEVLDFLGEWVCRCGFRMAGNVAKIITEKARNNLEKIDRTYDVKSLENFLKNHKKILYSSHYLCLTAKLSLSQLYGKINGYLIDQLDTNLLERKRDICEEILRIFDIIEPGYTRLRGVTLYELHAPLMILLMQKYQQNNRKYPKKLLKKKLKEIVNYLEEARIILGYEPENSPEFLMGKAAKNALTQMKNWEKIVGKL